MHPVDLLFDEIYYEYWGIPRGSAVHRGMRPDGAYRESLGRLVRIAAIRCIEHGLERCGHLCLAAARRLKALRSGGIIALPSTLRPVEGH